jgi:hypothetical protein
MWLTLVRHACARGQNNFEVHVLRPLRALAYAVRKDNSSNVDAEKSNPNAQSRSRNSTISVEEVVTIGIREEKLETET